MNSDKMSESLRLISKGIRSGYSSVITLAYKEILDDKEQQELAALLDIIANILEDRDTIRFTTNDFPLTLELEEKDGPDGEAP